MSNAFLEKRAYFHPKYSLGNILSFSIIYFSISSQFYSHSWFFLSLATNIMRTMIHLGNHPSWTRDHIFTLNYVYGILFHLGIIIYLSFSSQFYPHSWFFLSTYTYYQDNDAWIFTLLQNRLSRSCLVLIIVHFAKVDIIQLFMSSIGFSIHFSIEFSV